jgi:prepilin-type processing-associated H-X9-DG protein
MKQLTEPMRMERMVVQEITPEAMTVKWVEDGHVSKLSVLTMRRRCPCATCRVERDKMAANPLHVVKDAGPAHFELEDLAPVGRYAVNFLFSDGHSSGIYAWDYLRGLCECDACKSKQKA